LHRQPGVAAEQDQLPASVGLSEVRFDRVPVLWREVAKHFGHAAVLAGPSQFECAINCR